jgi:hypothetical protein
VELLIEFYRSSAVILFSFLLPRVKMMKNDETHFVRTDYRKPFFIRDYTPATWLMKPFGRAITIPHLSGKFNFVEENFSLRPNFDLAKIKVSSNLG